MTELSKFLIILKCFNPYQRFYSELLECLFYVKDWIELNYMYIIENKVIRKPNHSISVHSYHLQRLIKKICSVTYKTENLWPFHMFYPEKINAHCQGQK